MVAPNETPEADGEFVENYSPSGPPFRIRSKQRRVKPWLHIADTQRILAVAIVIVTLLIYMYLVVAVVFKWLDDEAFVRTVAALAPLQALAAATVGFFFGQREKSR